MATKNQRKPKPAKSSKKAGKVAAPKPAGKARRGAGGLRAVPDPLPRERPKDEAVALVPILQEADQRTADQKTNRAATRGKYVYCIMRTSELLKFGPIGIGVEPSDVTTVNFKDLAAVLSDVPMGVLDPTRENVLAHQRVNETVMKAHTVLPMSFGTVFRTADDIVELLRSAYDAFGDVLHKMQNKFELGLKVLWDRDLVIKEIEAEDEGLRRLKGEIASARGSTYFARVQYGRAVDSALQQRSERYVAELFEALRDVAVASRTNKPIGDKMILNAAFLVSRDKEQAFDARVKEIGSRYDKLTFRYTGPWPPYNFVNIRLKLERANAK
jgi:gas vesicle protein GvpL/GvpF